MKIQALKFEDFENEKLSRKEQKTVHGGEDLTDPSIGQGKGAGKP
ncbi:rSAM-modified peptide [Flavobacterium hibernum]|nr:rSAM-modified peptide [Flavobacterium hibernum]STO14733.1 Uncharacterised protein [Flavobacterium hibernum]